MVKYSIPVCNYNMGGTIERALESMLDQITEEYEVFVVDDGSTDRSRDVLSRMESEYGNLRTKFLPRDSDRRLGETRNISVRESLGDYVFLCMDADDVYYRDAIPDFATVYHQIDSQVDFEFYLKGDSINMASKDFLLNYGPYRNVAIGGEDRDLWRRLLADDAIIWLNHERFWREIGYEKTLMDRFQRDMQLKVADFQVGIELPSCIQWSIKNRPSHLMCYDLITFPIAYLRALPRASYDTPSGYRKKGRFQEIVDEERKTLQEIAEQYGVDINPEALSETGREIYYRYENS